MLRTGVAPVVGFLVTHRLMQLGRARPLRLSFVAVWLALFAFFAAGVAAYLERVAAWDGQSWDA